MRGVFPRSSKGCLGLPQKAFGFLILSQADVGDVYMMSLLLASYESGSSSGVTHQVLLTVIVTVNQSSTFPLVCHAPASDSVLALCVLWGHSED